MLIIFPLERSGKRKGKKGREEKKRRESHEGGGPLFLIYFPGLMR